MTKFMTRHGVTVYDDGEFMVIRVWRRWFPLKFTQQQARDLRIILRLLYPD